MSRAVILLVLLKLDIIKEQQYYLYSNMYHQIVPRATFSYKDVVAKNNVAISQIFNLLSRKAEYNLEENLIEKYSE